MAPRRKAAQSSPPRDAAPGLDPPISLEEQALFATLLRERIPKPTGEKYHRLYTFTEYANRVLGRKLLHWRGLTVGEARRVMAAVKAEYPAAMTRTDN
jgi:hypothetical protein